MKTGIALVGFMGTGKTAAGRLLAARLNKDFIELDEEIEKAAGKTIAAIFRDSGEARFREFETEAVKKIAVKKNTVIACGGGVVLKDDNVNYLKQECIIVNLAAEPADILKRVSRGKNRRPLLDVPDKESRIRELLEYRRPFYERAADFTVDTSGFDTEGVVEKIIGVLGNHENYD